MRGEWAASARSVFCRFALNATIIVSTITMIASLTIITIIITTITIKPHSAATMWSCESCTNNSVVAGVILRLKIWLNTGLLETVAVYEKLPNQIRIAVCVVRT